MDREIVRRACILTAAVLLFIAEDLLKGPTKRRKVLR